MKKLMQIAVMVLVMVFFTGAASAQEWSKDQTEVWKVVTDNWKAWKTGDADAVASLLHEKYQGWSGDSPIPVGKASTMETYSMLKESMTMNFYNIQPARIAVIKDAAVVDYFYYMNVTWEWGDQKGSKETEGKIVEFYVKEGGKWLLLGDMMVETEKDDD